MTTLFAQNAQAAIPTPPTAAPATIAASGNYNTGIMSAAGFKSLAAACTLSQAGTIVIQRYLDPLGTIAVGAPVSATLVAATANYVTVNDGVCAASWQVTINNTGGSTGNLTNTAFLASI
jgi:hypothetical protein